MPAIGIDLGTSYSCVGVWQRGKVEIIPNDQGNAVTPSYVAFTENERLVGDAAVSQMSADPANTIFDVKRMIGLRYDDPRIRDRARHWTFRVVEEGSKPKICVEAYNSEVESFYPEEICSMILRNIRKTAEARFREEIRDAVITVPACFNDRQRRLTKEAGARAGLNVLRVMNEPTAAALAYGLNENVAGAKNVLIFDLGGGTCDASVLSIEEGSLFEVKATAGDTSLGGEDFDARLVEYLAQEFERKHGKSLGHNPRALLRLRTAAERAKRKLSASAEATIEVDALCDGVDFRAKVTRARFVELCADLFEAAVRLVERALLEARMDKEFVHDVVLVGGSTRIPKIRSLLAEYFCGKRLNLSVNPDEAVAAGAAMQAAMLTRREIDRSELQDVLLVDVTPLSLGIETVGGAMTRVIARNASIPCTQTQTFTTNGDNQPGITIRVYEGERAMVRENDLLGTFQLGGITLAPRGVPKISVTFDVDANGILDVTATDNANGARNNIAIARIAEQLKHQDGDRYVREDNEKRDNFTAKNELEGYVLFVKQAIRSGKFPLREEDEDLMNCLCEDTLDWIVRNPVASKREYQVKREELQQRYSMILVKLDRFSSNSRKRIKF